ncbi:MAG: lipopolysaccharide assembly protein LapA domain-containing protein [bacterium]
MKAKTIALLVVLGLFVIILIQNMSEVQIHILLWPITMPKLILILASALLGWVVGWFSHVAYRSGKEKSKSFKKETKVKQTVEPKKEEEA